MRMLVFGRHVLMTASCLCLLAACEQFSSEGAELNKHPLRHTAVRSKPVTKPVASPAAHKTCTETFKLEVTDPRYDRCITSLSELEAKP